MKSTVISQTWTGKHLITKDHLSTNVTPYIAQKLDFHRLKVGQLQPGTKNRLELWNKTSQNSYFLPMFPVASIFLWIFIHCTPNERVCSVLLLYQIS